MAKEMGVPIRQMICASNENNVLSDFIRTGVYDLRARSFKTTQSPSIDILISSNLERWLFLLYDRDGASVAKLMADLKQTGSFQVSHEVHQKVQSSIKGGWATESECIGAMKSTFDRHGVLLDPHTAVAKHVAEKYAEKGVPMVVASTAHVGKFPSAFELAFEGKESWAGTSLEERWTRMEKLAPIPHSLRRLLDLPINHSLVLPADETIVDQTIRSYLEERQ